MTTPIIHTSDLTKQYQNVRVVDTVSLTVPRHAVYGLLGPNGAGKSTLINMLLDLVTPTAGTAHICKKDTQVDPVDVRRHVGVLPDGFSVFPRLSGRRHLQYVADARNVSPDTDTYLDRVGLLDSAGQAATTYSRGMQQRLGLAMALIGEPDVLLLDEPFAGLDPDGVRLLREIVTAENKRGTTILLSSHRLEQVERLCSRVGLLSDGQLLAEGEPHQLLETLETNNQYAVEVANAPQSLAEELLETAFVKETSVRDHTVLLTCTADISQDEVFTRIVESDVSVESFNSVDTSLEDLYTAFAEEES
ncbi:ABC transporter ATP-binding protein [Haladaptatus sp. DYF46]|uniref:ABC transporter ATP-binding protein n=1 Tax=Haladaptatus sp. DYF46 TaxID=2886041 RepID=UPI001E3C9EB2|nr:ABC transporter ATP-binding protein [Haladaptatus sp. DYF46]